MKRAGSSRDAQARTRVRSAAEVLVRENACVLRSDVVEVSAGVTATSARNAKIAQIAALLARAEPGQVAVAVAVLSGGLLQGRSGVGDGTIGDLLRAGDAAGGG